MSDKKDIKVDLVTRSMLTIEGYQKAFSQADNALSDARHNFFATTSDEKALKLVQDYRSTFKTYDSALNDLSEDQRKTYNDWQFLKWAGKAGSIPVEDGQIALS